MKINILITILALSVISCKSLKQNGTSKKNISISQNGKKIKVTNDKVIKLERKKFSIRYFVQEYKQGNYQRVSVAFFSSEKLFQMSPQNKNKFKGTPYAIRREGPKGTMLFADREEFMTYYPAFYKTKENGQIYHSVNLISKKEDFAEFELPIDKVQISNEKENIEDTTLKKYYIVIFIDKNNNKSIEDGELTKFTLLFNN